MATTAQFRMADRLAGGELESLIRHLRFVEELSFDSIAARLWAEYRIEVTGNTVRAWAKDMTAPEPETAA